MTLRKLIGGAVAGLGLAAVGNKVLDDRAGALPPALVGGHETYRWRGLEVAYTEAGDAGDPDLLLLHGIHAAASSQEFAEVIDDLAESYHVLAPDLPGFGRSDRPALSYDAALYEAFVEDVASDLTEDATVVATSLSGAYAATAATDAGVSRLVLICPTADTVRRRPWLHALFRSPVVGEAAFNLLTSRPSLRWFDRREAYLGTVDERTVEYQWRTAHQPGARYAPAAFVGGALDPDASMAELLDRVDVPVTLVWGRESTVTPLSTGRDLADAAGARLVVVDGTRLLPHDEAPGAFLDAVADDLDHLDR